MTDKLKYLLAAAAIGMIGGIGNPTNREYARQRERERDIQGIDVRMCPGRSDVAEIVDAAFPGEAAS